MPKGFEDFSFSAYVKTLAADNLVIDKLTQSAYTERRSTLENNGAAASMFAPGTTTRVGKFFPRGCRGFISTIEVYVCNPDAAAHNLYVYVSPQPGIGRLISLTLSVPAGSAAAWRSITVWRFWNYDSLFIYVLGDSDNFPAVGYDTGSPYDYVYSSDEATWTAGNLRLWIRVNMAEQTVGDIPVSGIVNTVELPSVGSLLDSETVRVNGGATVTLLSVEGAGKVEGLLHNVWVAAGSPTAANDLFQLVVDGVTYQMNLGYLARTFNFRRDTVSAFSLIEYDDTAKEWGFALNKPIHFSRSFAFRVYNNAAAGNDFHARCIAIITKVK